MHELKVSDLMTSDVVTLEEDEDLELADNIMHLARIRHLPVVNSGFLVGLITHRDILRAQASMFSDFSPSEDQEFKRAIKASDIMISNVTTVEPELSALEAARLMHTRKLGCLPVCTNKRLVGILTEADFVSLVIKALEDYQQNEDAE